MRTDQVVRTVLAKTSEEAPIVYRIGLNPEGRFAACTGRCKTQEGISERFHSVITAEADEFEEGHRRVSDALDEMQMAYRDAKRASGGRMPNVLVVNGDAR
jgi:hypothetical protein